MKYTHSYIVWPIVLDVHCAMCRIFKHPVLHSHFWQTFDRGLRRRAQDVFSIAPTRAKIHFVTNIWDWLGGYRVLKVFEIYLSLFFRTCKVRENEVGLESFGTECERSFKVLEFYHSESSLPPCKSVEAIVLRYMDWTVYSSLQNAKKAAHASHHLLLYSYS